MLLHCATLTEARPLIEALHLRKVYQKPFALFQSDTHRLVVSGIGTIHTAAALGWALGQRSEPVLNIGYATGMEVGQVYNIKKVIDRCTHKVYHLEASVTLPNAVCETHPKPLTTPTSHLADMEASAVVATAKVFRTPCTIVKIVSDRFNPEELRRDDRLIQKQIGSILSLL